MNTLKKLTSWALALALVLSLCTNLGGGFVQFAQVAFATIDDHQNSVFREILFTNTDSGLNFPVTYVSLLAVSVSANGRAMTTEREVGFVITRDSTNAYSVSYDDSMVSYIDPAYSATPMQTLSFVFSESPSDVAYQKGDGAFVSLAKWDGISPAPSLYYVEIQDTDLLTQQPAYFIGFAGFYGTDFPEGYDGITFKFSTDEGTFTVALTEQAIITHTVTFNLHYSVGLNPPETFDITVADGESLGNRFPDDPTRIGQTFHGWLIANDFPGAGSPFTEDTIVNGDIRVGAHWVPIPYAIDYDLAGGTVSSNPATYTIMSSAITLTNPTRAGFTFAGWLGTGLTAPTMDVTIPTGSTGDRTYLATWTVNTYTLTFDYGYDGIEETIENVSHGTQITLPTPTRPGYNFLGYSHILPDGTSGEGVSSPYSVRANTTLRAVWTAKPTTGITLNKSSTVINWNSSELLTVIFTPSDTLDRRINWISSDNTVATVNDNWRVTGHLEGTVTITAVLDSDGSIFDTLQVTVVEPGPSSRVEPEDIEIKEGNLDLDIGETEVLTTTVTPSNSTYQSVSWSSSNTSVATVDEYGVVTAVGKGTATITTAVNPAPYAHITDSITVTVTAPFVPVTMITGVNVNNMGRGGVRDLSIGATVHPASATNKAIEWEMADAGGTDATISSTGVLTTPSAGTVVVRATIANGAAESTPYTQNFTISVTASAAVITITFDPNFDQHHEGGTGTQSFTESQVIAGMILTRTDFPITARNGTATHTYAFLGYAMDAAAGAEVIDTFDTSGDTTLYAQWRSLSAAPPTTDTDEPFFGGVGTPEPEPPKEVYEFEAGTITLSEETLAELAELGGDVRVVLELVPMSELSGVQAAQVKGYETVVSIDVFVDGVKVDVPLTVSLPYTLKANEKAAGVNVWYLSDNGKLTNLNGVFDEETGLITFTITHQSYFVVGYDEALAAWDGRWTDVDGNEYFDAIAFIAWYLTELEETLFAGTGGTRFSPDMVMTRGQFMTVLHKLAGRPEHSDGDGFDDVAEDAWYYDAVLWGFETGIVAGIGGNLFAPDEELSREQMAVILSKYADYAGLELEALRELPEELEFSDWADEDGYITGLAGAGLLTGGGLDLTESAPRAEIALMFMEFVKLVLLA
ncbi:MAG: Ig-like domain-containing protein [Oscillospiraceae bacterium]|nr:Ig-like domain-containing protein [Oscillospiraceae bacterium]